MKKILGTFGENFGHHGSLSAQDLCRSAHTTLYCVNGMHF